MILSILERLSEEEGKAPLHPCPVPLPVRGQEDPGHALWIHEVGFGGPQITDPCLPAPSHTRLDRMG